MVVAADSGVWISNERASDALFQGGPLPADTLETAEIVVEGEHGGAVLRRQRGEVCVVDQICAPPCFACVRKSIARAALRR